MATGTHVKDHQREQRSFFQRTAVAGFVIVGLVAGADRTLVLLQVIRYGLLHGPGRG